MLLGATIFVPMICASVIPLYNYFNQKQREKSVGDNGYAYSFSSGLVNYNLDRLDSGSPVNGGYNSARRRGWIRGSSCVMDGEEFKRKRDEEYALQLP